MRSARVEPRSGSVFLAVLFALLVADGASHAATAAASAGFASIDGSMLKPTVMKKTPCT
jgi:hypothetical protein